MAIKINFDAQRNPEKPTFILSTRSGKKYSGIINAENIIVSDRLNDRSETTFKVRKYSDDKKYEFWNDLVNFKLLWCREWNMFLEATVELDESNETIKTVYGTQLGIAELSKLKLYNIEINTETDIAREDYDPDYPTVFYRNGEHKEASLLDRLLADKAPHYKIRSVAISLVNEQRVFTFDDISIYDAFQEIAQELDCLFIFHSGINSDGSPEREISVVDLLSYCPSCGHRGDFADECPKCNSKDVILGYGKDTTIFVTSDELADNIQYTTDTDSVFNCFKLECGDELMNATIRNCNPNGSDYIWYITESTKEDMSQELVDGLSQYDLDYVHYRDEEPTTLVILEEYNELIDKYVDKYNVVFCYSCGHKSMNISPGDECQNCQSINTDYCEELTIIPEQIIGYTGLMEEYYNTVDFSLFLESEMMPKIEATESTIASQIELIETNLDIVSVQNVNTAQESTVTSAVLGMAKVIIDSTRYTVEISNGQFIEDNTVTEIGDNGNTIITQRTWTGDFTIKDVTEEQEEMVLSGHQVIINGDYENFCKQKIDKTLNRIDDKDVSISGLFKLTNSELEQELKKYCKARLVSFNDACQSCLEVLIEQGVASELGTDIYNNLYLNYLDKQELINYEIGIRDSEIETIRITQEELIGRIEEIRALLSLDTYLGETLWKELCTYRREDTYSNENYISDGLDNKALFERAQAFIKEAEKEIFKSAELQHSISSSLKNLLVIDKFKPLVEHFEVGNWIRVMIDDSVYKLRFISYEIDYDNIARISVDFSDVMKTIDGVSDVQSVLDQAASMAGSYESFKKKAKDGQDGKNVLDNWVYNGLALTNMKIVGNADNQDIVWDHHGMLFREYLPDIDDFDPKQMKAINRGLYLTDDNWKTSRAAIGNFMFYNPKTGQVEEAYGVIADTLVGHLILSEEVGVYNTEGSVVIDKNGINIITDGTTGTNDMSISIQKKTGEIDEYGNPVIEDMFYVDSNGDLNLVGSVHIQSESIQNQIDESLTDVNSSIKNLQNENTSIIGAINKSNDELAAYKVEVGQYLIFGDIGLKIGANANGVESAFSTVIDNQMLSFMYNDERVAYMNGNQLRIRQAVIETLLSIGNYYFVPLEDKGLVVLWKDDIVTEAIKITSSPGKTMQAIAGESVEFSVEVNGVLQSITWSYSVDNERTWTIISTGSTSCTIDMPNTVDESEEAIAALDLAIDTVIVKCEVVGQNNSTDFCKTIVTLISEDDVEARKPLYAITYNLTNCISSNSATSVREGYSYYTVITSTDDNYVFGRCIVTMGEEDISSNFDESTGKLSISSVTGNIDINASWVYQNIQPIPVQIVNNPTDATVNEGETATFTVSANGSGLAYKWYVSKDNGSSWTLVNGETSSTLSFVATIYDNLNQYYCEVSDINGEVSSSEPAILTVNRVSTGENYTIEYSLTNCTSSNTATSIVDGNSYETYITLIDGATLKGKAITMGDKDITSGNIKDNGNGVYYINIAEVTGNLHIILNAYHPITITEQPQDAFAAVNETTTMTIGVKSNEAATSFNYQWQYNTSETDGTWHNTGSNSSTLSLYGRENVGRVRYRCIVTDNLGNSIISDEAIFVCTSIVITKQPEDVTTGKFYSGEVSFNVEAEGDSLSADSYVWQRSDDNTEGSWSDIEANGINTLIASTETSSTLTYKLAMVGGTTYRRCKITDSTGYTVYSEVVTYTIT